MANEKRLIYSDSLFEEASKAEFMGFRAEERKRNFLDLISAMLANCPTVDAFVLPCKIGDFVWAIRNFKGNRHPQRGIVSDMFFTNDMRLQIVVKYVARGEWGKTVFATDKEAYAAIEERRNDNG